MMVPKKKREPILIDDAVKKLILEGVAKTGSRDKLAKVLGYSTPSNIISQFLSAPKYKRSITASRFEKLKKFLGKN